MNETKDRDEKSIYEVGYHIVPTVEESEIPAYASKIKSGIEENESAVISEEMPKIIPLAYDISKNVSGKKHIFSKAYFGWVKFETEPSHIGAIKSKLDATAEVLRFIIVKTVRENTMHVPKAPMFRKENNRDNGRDVVREEKDGEPAEEKPKASEEEIDKSIDELVIS